MATATVFAAPAIDRSQSPNSARPHQRSLFAHTLPPTSHGPSRRPPIPVLALQALLPTGHPSWPTRRGTCPTSVLHSAGSNLVAPAEPARLVSLRQPSVSEG